MAKREPVTIELGNQTFEIRPTTISQLEKMDELSRKSTGGITLAKGIIAIAMERDHAGVDIGSLEVSTTQLMTSMNALLRLAGFITDDPATIVAMTSETAAAVQTAATATAPTVAALASVQPVASVAA